MFFGAWDTFSLIRTACRCFFSSFLSSSSLEFSSQLSGISSSCPVHSAVRYADLLSVLGASISNISSITPCFLLLRFLSVRFWFSLRTAWSSVSLTEFLGLGALLVRELATRDILDWFLECCRVWCTVSDMIDSSLYKSFFFCSHSAVFWSNSACCLASWSLCSLSSRRVCSWACLSFSALSLSAMSSYSCSGFLSSVPFFSSLSIFAYMVDMTSSSHLAKWVCR